MNIDKCCVSGFAWNGTPSGLTATVPGTSIPSYVAGDNPSAALLMIHDLLGWTFPNARLLADHYAKEGNVTVYLPDFYSGEVLPFEPILAERWAEVDLKGFMERNGRDKREPAIFECAKALRRKYENVGAVGFCYGGWAVCRLGSLKTGNDDNPLLSYGIMAHPSLVTKEDISGVDIPMLVLAPEHDRPYNAELKMHTFETFQKRGIYFNFVYFPGVYHGGLVRGDEEKPGEREAMIRAKNAVTAWVTQFT